jgi:DNA replication ATP-dependent helicase Dna2
MMSNISKVSTSTIASYFYTECEKQLYKASYNIPGVKKEPKENPYRQKGDAWEEKVRQRLRRNHQLLSLPTPKALGINDLFRHIHHTIQTRMSTAYIDNKMIEVPDTFYKKYSINTDIYTFKHCKPDLIEIENDITNRHVTLKVIDIKSSEESGISHKIQVSFYVMVLGHYLNELTTKLQEMEYSFILVDQSGGLWNHNQEHYAEFETRVYVDMLSKFISGNKEAIAGTHQLWKIMEQAPELLKYHVGTHCKQCPYLEECKGTALEEEHVSLIPSFSKNMTKFMETRGLKPTLGNLSDLLSSEKEKLEKYYLFKGKTERLKAYLETPPGRCQVILRKLFPFPKDEDYRVTINVQRDPISKIFFGLGFRIDHPSSGKTEQFIHTIGHVNDERFIIRSFLKDLVTFLEEHYGNRVHFYFYDQSQYLNYLELLKHTAQSSRENILQATQLLLCFSSEKALASSQASDELHLKSLSYTVLTHLFSDTFLVNSPFFYDLETVRQAFDIQESIQIPYREELTNNIGAEYLYQFNKMDYNEKEEAQKSVLKYLEDYLLIVQNMILRMKSLVKDHFPDAHYRDAGIVNLPEIKDFQHDIIAKLVFFTYHESIKNYEELIDKRKFEWDAQRENGGIFEVSYNGAGNFTILNSEGIDFYNGAISWLAVPKDEHGWYALNYYDRDGKKSANFHFQRNHFKLYELGNLALDPEKAECLYLDTELPYEPQRLENEMKITEFNSFFSSEIASGKNFILAPKFFDFTGPVTAKRLIELDDEMETNENAKMVFGDEQELTRRLKSSDHLLKLADEHSLRRRFQGNKHQNESFKKMISQNIQMLWEPPGTGKSYFISHSLLTYSELLLKADSTHHTIVVSAATNEALELVLLKVLQLLETEEYQATRDKVNILKVGRLASNAKIKLEPLIEKNDRFQFLRYGWRIPREKSVTFIFATPYQFQKAYSSNKLSNPVDTIVIDEASQCKVPDALLLLSRLKEQTGRVLFVGDDFQLPPVVKGQYEDEWEVTKSIFSLLKRKVGSGKFLSILYENFRSNNHISGFPAKMIYTEEYRSNNPKIGEATLNYDPMKVQSELASSGKAIGVMEEIYGAIFNDESPLVLCELKDSKHQEYYASRRSDVESALIFKLVEHLSQTVKPEKIFIVCPHKVQISSLRYFFKKHHFQPIPMIGTVDKMQGNEADVVIVSYAISDLDLIKDEASFIFNRNRLNVAITRAQQKAILFLSEKLFDVHFLTSLEEEQQENIEFLTGLKGYLQKKENLNSQGLHSPFLITFTALSDELKVDFPEKEIALDLYQKRGVSK